MSDMSQISLGNALQAARAELEYSQDYVAAQIGVTSQQIDELEHDRSAYLSDPAIESLARLLDLSQDHLYFLAGRLPPDIRGCAATPQQARLAFQAVRRLLALHARVTASEAAAEDRSCDGCAVACL